MHNYSPAPSVLDAEARKQFLLSTFDFVCKCELCQKVARGFRPADYDWAFTGLYSLTELASQDYTQDLPFFQVQNFSRDTIAKLGRKGFGWDNPQMMQFHHRMYTFHCECMYSFQCELSTDKSKMLKIWLRMFYLMMPVQRPPLSLYSRLNYLKVLHTLISPDESTAFMHLRRLKPYPEHIHKLTIQVSYYLTRKLTKEIEICFGHQSESVAVERRRRRLEAWSYIPGSLKGQRAKDSFIENMNMLLHRAGIPPRTEAELL